MVNKERVQLWIDALRSGEYTQGSGYLKAGNNYCCLGVACEVAIKNGLDIQVAASDYAIPNNGGLDAPIEFDGESEELPASVEDWYGFENSNPPIFNGTLASYVNDVLQLTFTEIADMIAETYLNDSE